MILGVPVFEHHALTAQMVASLAATVRGDFTLVIVDNASPTPYRRADYDVPFRLRVVRNERNEGNFYPLAQVAELEPGHEVVALAHNDLIYYEAGWNLRVDEAFADPLLGMVGFAGSASLDDEGHRGGVVSNLRGTRGHASAEDIGVRVTDLRPSVAVDGLFMAFRRGALAALTLDRSLPPAHFYDFIWGAQVIDAGWRLGTLGVEVDHIGWSTEVGQAAALDPEWRRWCIEQGIDAGADPMAAIRAVGAQRWAAFRGRFYPAVARW
jgi:hypothetical protein